MNKLFTKIAIISASLSMAIGVGVAVASGSKSPVGVSADYSELYSADFTSVATHSYTQNKTFTLDSKSWTSSVSQVNGGVFYLGCNSNNASKGVLGNNSTFSAVNTALIATNTTYTSGTSHAYALLFDNAYSDVTKVEFTWAGGNNAFQVYLFGKTSSGYSQLGYTNYASSGASVSGSVTWTGDATDYTGFAIAAKPGTPTSNATNKTLRAATFKLYKTSGGDTPTGSVAVTLDKDAISIDMYTGTTASLKATADTTGSATAGLKATSSDTDVATVSTAAPTSGTAFTVTGVAVGTATITVESTWDSSKKAQCTVTVTDSTPVAGETVLTFDVSSNPGGWPTTNSTTLTDYTYTLNNVSYTFKLSNVKQNSGYLMLTQVAVLGLPALSGKKLTKVEATNSGGGNVSSGDTWSPEFCNVECELTS